MRKSGTALTTLVLLQLTGASTPANAARVPERDGLRAREMRVPELLIRTDQTRADQATAAVANAAAVDLATLAIPAASAYVDDRTGRWALLHPVEPMFPGVGNDLSWNELSRQSSPASSTEYRDLAWQRFSAWVAANQDALRVDPSEFNTPTVTSHNEGALVQIHITRSVGGVPVRDAVASAVINHGNLILFGAEKWGDVSLPAIPDMTSQQASLSFLSHVSPAQPADPTAKAHLEYVPVALTEVAKQSVPGAGLGYRLAWVYSLRFPGSDAEWEAMVDANSGELLAFVDKTNYVAATRNVIGGTYPVTNDGSEPGGTLKTNPIPYATITVGSETYQTDTGGNVRACVDGTASTALKGAYIEITDICGIVNESSAASTFDLGGTPNSVVHDCTIPPGHSAGDTASARSAYYEINHMAEMARGHLPDNAWIREPLGVTVNIQNFCNATGGPGGLNFYRSGGGCTNTGEIAGIFDHEWGHGMDGSDAAPGISSPGESVADMFGNLRLNNSCVGHNFEPGVPCGGYGNPCTTCTGVRDSDWAKHVNNTPTTVTITDAVCGAFGTGGPCGGEVHCEGMLPAEAAWDLWNRDLTGAPFNQSLDTARELATRLTFLGGGNVVNWFSCTQGQGGCAATNGYQQYLAADDDNGNLNDGTPHMGAIFAAYDRHGVACSTPTNQNAGCASTPAGTTTVSTTPFDRGVIVSWTAVAGATNYRVYRTEGEYGCAFGKTWIAETTGLTHTDLDGLQNGRTYNYMVIPMGATDSCYGVASACTPAVPAAGANLAYRLQPHVNLLTGDGDGLIDNCEAGQVYFSVDNIGTGSLTNVRVASASSPSHPSIDSSISFPSTFAPSLGACATATGGFQFIASGLDQNDAVVFDVEVTADEISPRTIPAQVTVSFAENSFQQNASVTFSFEADTNGWTVEQGTFNRSGAGGGNGTTFSERSSAFLHDQCDRVRSPLLQIHSTSTLSLYNNYDIEPFSAGTWYDRANVSLAKLDDGFTVVNPNGGRPYNAAPGGPGTYSGCNDGEQGWAGTQATWGTSSWSAPAFGAAVPNNTAAQLRVTYSTDPALAQNGFWFDEVTVTDVGLAVLDSQSNSCTNSFIFADGFESGSTALWSAHVP